MARVTDYASLATAVQAYLTRSEVGVASGNLDYLCSEAEEEMNARLRVRRMLTAITPTVSSAGVVTLPSDFGGWVRFQVRDGSREWDLDLLPAEQVTSVWDLYGSAGSPKALISTGATSQVWPYTDGAYTFAGLYYARVPALTSSATTNWVISNFPNAYLYGCLAAARGFIKDDAPAMQSRFDRWEKRFKDALARIEREASFDVDARKNATTTPDTTLFSRGGGYNVLSDSSR
jgi:hypothetical protein